MKKHNILSLLSIALITTGVQAQNLTPIQSQLIGNPTFSISNNRTTGETQVQVMPTPGVVLSTTNSGGNGQIQNATGNVTPIPNNLDEEGPQPSQSAIRGINVRPNTNTTSAVTNNVTPSTNVSSNSSQSQVVPSVNTPRDVQNQSKPAGQVKPSTSHVYADISSWNKTTIQEHELQGKKIAEEQYKLFLMK